MLKAVFGSFLLALGIYSVAQNVQSASRATSYGGAAYGYQIIYTYLPTVITQGSSTKGGPLAWLTPYGANHYSRKTGDALTCIGGCGFQALVNFTSPAQYYNFQIVACVLATPIDATTGQTMWFLNQGAVGWNSSGTFTQQVTNADPNSPCTTAETYTWKIPVQSGIHLIQLYLSTDNATLLTVNTASISATTGTVSPEPAGSRDATQFPFSSYSLWNTAIGSNAAWSLSTDGDTRKLNGLTGVINSSRWSIPIYQGAVTDPVGIFEGPTSGPGSERVRSHARRYDAFAG